MRRGWGLSAIAALAGWALYVVFGAGPFSLGRSLGGGMVFLVAIPLCAFAGLLRPSWQREAASLLVSSAGFVALNHLLTLLRHRPLDWPPPATLSLFAVLLVLALLPLLSVNYWVARKPEQEPHLAKVLLSFFLIQVFPVLGVVYALAFLPALKHASPTNFPGFALATLLGGVTGASLLARWLLRRLTGDQIRALLLPSMFRPSPAPDGYAWSVAGVLLVAGTILESLRGEWLAWIMQTLGLLGTFMLVWQTYREVFRPPGGAVPAVDTFRIPLLPVSRLGMWLWLLIVFSAITVAAIQSYWWVP